MILAENIVTAYRARTKSENWAKWAGEHQVLAEILGEAEKLCQQQKP
jgi:hypothetical protein